jgi:hypothetical protein
MKPSLDEDKTSPITKITSFSYLFFQHHKRKTQKSFPSFFTMPINKYFCDYCERSFNDTLLMRRKHLECKTHQLQVKLYYDSFPSSFEAQPGEWKRCRVSSPSSKILKRTSTFKSSVSASSPSSLEQRKEGEEAVDEEEEEVDVLHLLLPPSLKPWNPEEIPSFSSLPPCEWGW